MNKKLLVTAISLGALALASAGVVSASTLTNQTGNKPTTPPHEQMMEKSDGLAEFLGINQDDLRTALDNARTKAIEDLAVANGKTVDELNTFLDTQKQEREDQMKEMQTKMKERLAEDVASGKITQAQADEMSTNSEKGRGHGPRGNMPQDMNFGDQTNDQNSTETQS